MDSIVKMKVAEAIADERDKYRKTENELVRTKNILRVSLNHLLILIYSKF